MDGTCTLSHLSQESQMTQRSLLVQLSAAQMLIVESVCRFGITCMVHTSVLLVCI